jgi:F-type H+-transporting ATPase subunit b
MDATLHALGGILLRAVPTFLLVILLHFYLKFVFFKPLEKVLHRRYEATEGARKLAEESLQRAAAKASEYEAAMRAARADLYHAADQLHKQLQERETASLAAARKRAEEVVRQSKDLLAKEVEEAKTSLARDSEALANQIAETILRRSAA